MTIDPRFLDDLAGRLGDLTHLPDAPRAEAWVSGLVGELADEARRHRTGEADALAEFVAHVAGRDGADVLAWILGRSPMADLAPTSDPDGPPPVPWAAAVGTSVAVAAWIVAADSRTVVLEYEDDQAATHALLVEIDAEQHLVDLHVGPGGFVDALGSDAERFTILAVDPGEAAAEAAAAAVRPAPGEPTDGLVLNRFLAEWRLGVQVPRPEVEAAAVVSRPADPEGDRAGVEVLVAALRSEIGRDRPAEVAAVAAGLRAASDSDTAALFRIAGVADPNQLDDADLVLAVAGAYVSAADLSDHGPAEIDEVLALEWADWLGAVVGAVRAGPGRPVDGRVLVDHVNRCPEVGSSIPAPDRPIVAEAFDLTLWAWERAGVLDAEGRLTELGRWALPRALARAWGGVL